MKRRSWKEIWKDATRLLWEDIKKMRFSIILIMIVLGVNRIISPVSCISVAITGYPCAGCGMTRAILAFLKGEWGEAFRIHPFVFVWILFFLYFLIWRYILQKDSKVFVKYLIVIILAMIIYYVYRMATQFPSEPPMSYYRNNLIRNLINKLQL